MPDVSASVPSAMGQVKIKFDRGDEVNAIPVFGFKDFATQAKNAEIIKTSDRYLVF